MSNADEIMVRPLSTYYDQGERKSVESEPYRVTRAHGEELRGLGIAEVVEPPKGRQDKSEAPPAASDELATEPVTSSDRPRRNARS